MRVAFVSANRENLPDAVIPLGLLYVHAATPATHDKRLFDVCFEDDPEEYLTRSLADYRPDVVAIGLRNIQNNDYSGISDNLDYYASLIATVREVTGAPIVLGGGGFSVMPEGIMRRLRPDFGIAGEGEQPFPMLLEAIEAGDGFDEVPNLLRFEGGELVHHGLKKAYVDMDQAPIPDRTLADRRYYEGFGIDSVQTKRGCNLRCDYCTYPTIEGRVTRRRAPSLVVDEFRSLSAQNPDVRHVFVVDSVFNLPPGHAKDICRELIARGPGLPWTCYSNPLRFDDELAELMVAAGCVGTEIGSDSGCDDILRRLMKGFDTTKIRSIRECCARAGLKDCHTFILGTPGETLDHVKRTLDFIVELDPFAAVLGCWVDDYEALDPALRKERIALRDRIHELFLEHKAMYPRWIMPPLGVNFDPRMFRALRRAGLTGPLWQHIDMLGGPARRPPAPKDPSASRPLPVVDD